MLFNDNAEYKVSVSDKSVKEVKIPAYYNGLPVTEVADNAFISCASLERAEIPATVKRVGNNAFYNCRALKRVVGMANVTVIGNNAFAMCAALENLIIPPKVNSMGSYVIRNVTNPVYVRSTKEAFNALNANWNRNSTAQIIYGNDLVCDPIYEEEGRIKGYEITAAQNLMETEDYELLCSYRHRECNGAECKDEECANQHTERYYPILEFAQNAFENSFFHSLTVKYDEAHIPERFPVNINSKAFYVVMADSIDIQVDITLNDDLNDDSLYSEWEKGKSVNVFAYSTITSITLPDSLTDIPRYSFAGCASLRHINNSNSEIAANTLSDNITVIGDNAFQECTALEVLNIPATVEHIGDNAFAFWGSWEAEQTIKIDLYKAGEQWDKNWKGSLGTNASVQFNTMSVLFERQEGEGGSDGAEVTYGDPMPAATAPERIGYTFLGYYTAPGGQGEQYYDGDMASAQNWNIITDEVTTLYAHWSANVYTVLLSDGVTVQAVFGEAMPAAPKPATEKGQRFEGYYAPNGEMYYDGNMVSAHVWDIAEDNVQLRATMTPIDYKIVLNDNVIVYARYGEEMPPAPAPAHVPGRIFTGYSYNGTLYYNADMTSAHVWDREHGARLVFESVMSVLFERQEGEGGSDGAEVTYGDPMPAATAPERIGYTFLGYYTAPGGQGEQYYDGDMASAQNWNIITDEVTTLYAHWSANVYTVLLSDGVTVQAVFGEAMPAAPKPATEKGQRFEGYYAPNGEMYYDGNMVSAHVWDIAEDNVQLRATMTPIDYKIVLNDNVIVYARYGEEMPPAPAPAHVPGRIFTGYSYNGTLYYNADMTSAHVWDLEHGAQLVFESVELVTHITYDLDGGVNASGNPETLKYSETVVLQAPEKRGYCFDGWYLNGKKVINLIEIDAENITLTARWIGRFVQVYQGDYRFNVSELPYVIFELPESLRYNCTVNIAADVQQVYIYSPYKNKTYNINIEIENRTTDFNLLLENVTITAGTLEYKQIPTISMESSNNSALNLYTYGNVVIRGATGYEEQYGKGYEGGVAVQCNTLCFRYAETLYIYGGDGGQGYRDYESGNGGNAIVVERDLIMPSGHSIIIVGGSNFELQMSAIPIIIKSGNDIIFY